jgi:protease-4
MLFSSFGMNMKSLRFFILILSCGIAFAACTLVNVDLGPSTDPFEERTVAGEGADKVLLINIAGVLMEGRTQPLSLSPWAAGENLISRLTEELDKAEKDQRVKALVLKINSPGGSVAASDLIRHQIERFAEKRKIKVVAQFTSVAASGGYYVATAADSIVALPSTTTGSIGVIAVKLDLSGLMGRYGVAAEVVKSAALKDMWSPFKPAGPEERRAMQTMIDEMFEQFKAVVREGRPNITDEQLKRATTGEIFPASKALELGLIDRVGYPEDAFEEAKKLAGLKQARLVVYHRPGAHRPNVYAQAPQIDSGPESSDLFSISAVPQLMYLWLPAAGANWHGLGLGPELP